MIIDHSFSEFPWVSYISVPSVAPKNLIKSGPTSCGTWHGKTIQQLGYEKNLSWDGDGEHLALAFLLDVFDTFWHQCKRRCAGNPHCFTCSGWNPGKSMVSILSLCGIGTCQLKELSDQLRRLFQYWFNHDWFSTMTFQRGRSTTNQLYV